MSTSRPRVFLDISIGSEPAGRLVVELFADKTPKTCDNFRALCSASHPPLTYRLSPFHRIIDEFMVQGGDITKGDGTGGDSIYGGEFADENIGWRDMDAAGLVCMANRGKATNSSQFFLTLEPCPHLNEKHTIFGHLVSGQDVLARMAKVRVDKNDRPLDPVLVARCGELERKKRPGQAAPLEPASASDSAGGRGRKHRRHSSSPSQARSRTPPRKSLKARRQSDLVVDENLRGRPRKRSKAGSRSGSQAMESSSRSPAPDKTQVQRKRDPSPSRGAAKEASRSHSPQYRQRRRSLPNQYRDDGNSRQSRDERDARDRKGGRGRNDGMGARSGGRRNDGGSYRPARDRGGEEGRLGGGDDWGDAGAHEPAVKFKGRGSMKYKEPNKDRDRRW